MRILISCVIAFWICVESQAAVTLQGSTEAFFGPGIYTFDFTVTAIGNEETIIGFTVPLDNLNGAMPLPEVPDVSLSNIAFMPNPLLELRLASSDFTGSNLGFSVSAEDANNSPLILSVGESAVLFSIPMNVTALGPVLGPNSPLATLQSITTLTGSADVVNFVPASVTAIPEPSGLSLVAIAVSGLALRRQRRRVEPVAMCLSRKSN